MTMLYDMPLYRPPSEGPNLIIQATLGCSFNGCTFCSMYKTKTFTARPLDDVFADIDDAAQDWPDAHRVFLADGDALVLPTDIMLRILGRLKARLPDLARVSCYATPINLLRKPVEELRTLKEAGLTLLYVGIESGSADILRRIRKGATAASMERALTRAADAGMKVSATVVLGLGGR
ncbi:MAG: radical SAM protein, partial [Rhodospirillales bacterium]|nr:radical SAM protein [Rhodospirillales bacterium]